MKTFSTTITTVTLKGYKIWPGPICRGSSFEDAQRRLDASGKGYCKISAEIIFQDEKALNNLSPFDLLTLSTSIAAKAVC